MKRYSIWISIEEFDEETGDVQDVEVPRRVKNFDTVSEAEFWASALSRFLTYDNPDARDGSIPLGLP